MAVARSFTRPRPARRVPRSAVAAKSPLWSLLNRPLSMVVRTSSLGLCLQGAQAFSRGAGDDRQVRQAHTPLLPEKGRPTRRLLVVAVLLPGFSGVEFGYFVPGRRFVVVGKRRHIVELPSSSPKLSGEP